MRSGENLGLESVEIDYHEATMRWPILSILATSCIASVTSAENLLVNGSFEDDFTRWNGASAWQLNGTFPDPVAALDGEQWASLLQPSGINTQHPIYNIAPVIFMGPDVQLSGFATLSESARLMVTLADRDFTPFASMIIAGPLSTWTPFHLSGSPSSGGVFVKVALLPVPFESPSAGANIDGLQLMYVPEPTTGLMIFFCTAVIALRRCSSWRVLPGRRERKRGGTERGMSQG